ncbi:MAG: undecaprenyldiphospho-muramoylpentapeptide beta-N-acetylglucosaminyltransferase, partial [Candidatus Krumholzibacteria bacterium]|nr:undecaprenyldiphospho-muramoylpentapeptide beta-N-acetylglucosaminyltransferase [Candidatus Krumholzibacteria bacterium]
MRVLFAGGGTGGHLYPALAVAEELASRGGLEALFVGTGRGLEATVVPAAGYPLRRIVSRGVRGKGPVAAAATLAMLIAGTVQAAAIIARFRPDVVFGSGGYASAAAVMAAFVFRRAIVLQEQNSIPGMANRMLAPLARRIYVGFEQAGERLGGGRRVVWTGNPLRRSIRPRRDPSARRRFGLRPDAPVLLVFGGSQGAMRLNRAAARLLRSRPGLQGIVQTGERGYDETRRELEGIGPRVFAAAYIDDIEEAYASADVALARAGALSVSELAAVGLPSVLVPYPHAADNHQWHNARVLVEAGGAALVADADLDETTLAAVVDP